MLCYACRKRRHDGAGQVCRKCQRRVTRYIERQYGEPDLLRAFINEHGQRVAPLGDGWVPIYALVRGRS